MMKNFFCFCFLFLMFSAEVCYSAPSYGTKMPKQNQVFWGGQTYSVVKRNLDGDNGKLNSLQHFLLISYGITDWFSLDLKGGAGDTHQTPDSGDEISYPAYLSGGYGFRIRLFETEATKAVFGFQHISVHPYSVFVGNVKRKAVIDDWQFSILASQRFEYMTPYIGTRWSRMDYIRWIDDARKRVKSKLGESVGIIIGTDVPMGNKIWLNFEGQFLDAQALAASVNFHF